MARSFPPMRTEREHILALRAQILSKIEELQDSILAKEARLEAALESAKEHVRANDAVGAKLQIAIKMQIRQSIDQLRTHISAYNLKLVGLDAKLNRLDRVEVARIHIELLSQQSAEEEAKVEQELQALVVEQMFEDF